MFSIPIFPLPNVVLFPNVFLPLHIFEPRYRQMVAESLDGDRMIGMVLLRPGHEADYDSTPPVYPTGCSGLITHSEQLEDGGYNLVLRGVEKFTIQHEEPVAIGRLYRSALVTAADESVTAGARITLRLERQKLQNLVAMYAGGRFDARLPDTMPDDDLINALAQYLEFDPLEKLALLERPGPLARCRSLVELLEIKAMVRDRSEDSGMIH